MRNYSIICDLLAREASGKGNVVHIGADDALSYELLTDAGIFGANVQTDAKRISKAYEYVQKLAKDRKAVYGLTTSFGGNIHHIIPPEEAELLQENLILSHATNVGEHFPYHITKAAFILRTTTLAKGYSGLSPATIELAVRMIEAGIVPVVNMHGSLGASGDIAPLAALALAMIGKGKVWLPDGKTIVPSEEGLKKHGLKPIKLSYKEGLALLNGTSMMTSVASFTLRYLKRLLENSLVISAMSIEALRASKKPFDARLHQLKPHRYEMSSANVMAAILENSKLARAHEQFTKPLEQELKEHTEAFYSKTDLQGGSYSLRAIPQVYHPILAAYEHLRTAVDTEINAIDDNPVVLPDEHDELHGANFHGYPISVASDSLNLAMVGVSNMALARSDRLLKQHHSHLPWFLATGKEGLYLGMHGIQFTAAGIGAELRNMATPNSIVQIPTNNDNQDFVSFGLQSTLKGLEMTMILAYVVAIEYMTAGQGIWLNLKGKSDYGPATEKDLSPVTHSAYQQMLKVYQPKEDTDQNMVEQTEELARQLMLTSLLPESLSETLWHQG